jgi:hypothetical protein
MKLYIIDWGSGWNFTYLLGDLGQDSLKDIGDQFHLENPAIGIDFWYPRFVQYLINKRGLTEIKDIEEDRPQSHGVDYVYP